MSEPLVRVHNLCKSFGKLQAVHGVSFDIDRGRVVGFIGENGAGKTTTMRMMVTLEIPDFGYIRINGIDAVHEPGKVRRMVGWMPDAYGTYDFMTVFEYLDFFARAYGFEGKERQMRVQEVMEFTDLLPLSDRPMNKLSKGMGQRLCLGRTLLPDPDLLVLDEPAAGLDPKARIEFKNLVRLLAEEGKTLFISSHILSELEQMCDSMLFISGGCIVHHGSSESLKNRDGGAVIVRVEFAEFNDGIHEWISLQAGVELVDQDKHGVRLKLDAANAERRHLILSSLVKDGFRVSGFHRQETRLEDAFVEILTRGNGGGV